MIDMFSLDGAEDSVEAWAVLILSKHTGPHGFGDESIATHACQFGPDRIRVE